MKATRATKVAGLFVALATALTAATSVAQTNNSGSGNSAASGARKASARGTAAKPGVTTVTPRPNNTLPAESAATQTAPATATSTAQVPTLTTKVKERPYKISLYTRTSATAKSLHKKEGSPNQLSYVGASYQLTPERSLGVRQEFSYSYGTQSKKGEGHILDPFVQYIDAKLAQLPYDVNVMTVARYYAPTGETSRFVTKSNGLGVLWFLAEKEFGKFSITAGPQLVYYLNSQDGYMDSQGKMQANTDYEVNLGTTLTYNISPELSVWHDISFENYFYRPVAGANRGNLYLGETAVTYKPMKKLSVTASLFNNVDLFSPSASFRPFRRDETTYRLALATSL